MKKYIILVLVSFIIGIFASYADATTFQGLVTKVHDGDTMTVLNEANKLETVRLYRIDTPEMKGSLWPYQPHANEARFALYNLCFNKVATVIRKSKSYSRTVGEVSCQGTSTVDYMVLTGNAWVYRYTSTKTLRLMQADAKSRNIGLWAKPAVEPYLWRKGIRQ